MNSSQRPLFLDGETVKHRSTGEFGVVRGEPTRTAGEYWYRIQFSHRRERMVESDLDALAQAPSTLEEVAAAGAWGRLTSFRSALTVERISTKNRSTVYAFRSQRILFEAYQYKPLLKILDSRDRRILIADEVGLGKTIEAGLILTELEARQSLERILIVCPSRLRDKWREELNRKFDQDFEILGGADLRAYVARIQANPTRTRLRGIASLVSLRSEQMRNLLRDEIGQFDLVIFDEAHHCRNPSTSTSQLLRDLAGISDAVALLSATPIQLRTQDLHTLLNALRPEEFSDPVVFDEELKHFAVVHEASRLVRTGDANRLAEAEDKLRECFLTGLAREDQDPVARQVIEDMASVPADRREWVDLERRVTELHPLASIVTRTRKRDVQEKRPQRRATVVECSWTPQEAALYERFIGPGNSQGWFGQRVSLGQIQRARQAASCLPAAIAASELPTAEDDLAVELTDIPPSDLDGVDLRADNDNGVAALSAAGMVDSKYDALERILDEVWKQEPNAKILVFTFFRGTARYLADRLARRKIGATHISGDVPSDPRNPDRDLRGKQVAAFREDPSVLVMVSTEVGSEGLDFQFCHHVVNYDLPWNPMVVEQRIGRIDRYGQQSDVVHIWNLVVKGSVEQRILERLYSRIGIFEASIGDLEEILGNVLTDLQREYLAGHLTPSESEARVEQAARAIEHRQASLRALEKQAAELFGHEEFISAEMDRVKRLGRFIGDEALLSVVRMFLDTSHPQTRLWEDKDEQAIWNLRLTEQLRHDIETTARRAGTTWSMRGSSDTLRFTTLGDVAFSHPSIELLNVGHPLLRLATDNVSKLMASAEAKTGQACVRIAGNDDTELHEGLYFLAVYSLAVEGVRQRKLFEVFAWCCNEKVVLVGDVAERLLHLVMTQGEEWSESEAAAPMTDYVFRCLSDAAVGRASALRQKEQRENEALYIRRRQTLQAEFERATKAQKQRIQTAEKRGNKAIIPAMRGQLQKLEVTHADKITALDKARDLVVPMSDEPIAMCAVRVLRPTAPVKRRPRSAR